MRWKSKEKVPKPVVDKEQWHPFFSLIPRKIDGTWVWLEWVERRLVEKWYYNGPPYEHIVDGKWYVYYWDAEYRLTAKDN